MTHVRKVTNWLLVTNVIMNTMINAWERQECLNAIASVQNNLNSLISDYAKFYLILCFK